MKEVTYEDWIKNPIPRMMWVWNDDENYKRQRKVVYYSDKDVVYPVFALTQDEVMFGFKHCAEIGKTRRMTKKELSRWLREKPTREFKYDSYITRSVCSTYTYNEDEGDEEVRNDIVIREDDGEWREPLVEV